MNQTEKVQGFEKNAENATKRRSWMEVSVKGFVCENAKWRGALMDETARNWYETACAATASVVGKDGNN